MATKKKTNRDRETALQRLIVFDVAVVLILVFTVVGHELFSVEKEPEVKETIIISTPTVTSEPQEIYTEIVALSVSPTSKPTSTPTSTPTEELYKPFYFDCPLSEELQDYIFELCADAEVPVSLVIAIIDKESEFKSDAISKTGDWGYMQINECNHDWLAETYGISDFLDPRDNIFGGVMILRSLCSKYENPHRIAMSYNMGENGAKKAWESGTTSTAYSRDVVELWEMYEEQYERGNGNDKQKTW